MKQIVPLKAISISFTDFSIVYEVEFPKNLDFDIYPVYCLDNISDKELILKPTLVSKDKNRNKVVFTTSNVTPSFYQDLLNKILKDWDEYIIEKNHIYNVGDVVCYILYELK